MSGQTDRPTNGATTSGRQPEDLSGINPARLPLAGRRRNERRLARPFEQPRLASPRSMSLLAHDRLARHEREILDVMPPLARSGAGARSVPSGRRDRAPQAPTAVARRGCGRAGAPLDATPCAAHYGVRVQSGSRTARPALATKGERARPAIGPPRSFRTSRLVESCRTRSNFPLERHRHSRRRVRQLPR